MSAHIQNKRLPQLTPRDLAARAKKIDPVKIEAAVLRIVSQDQFTLRLKPEAIAQASLVASVHGITLAQLFEKFVASFMS
jgi:hypothetical protein